MPDIAFHTGVADKLHYACRLLRKAYRQQARVAVAGDEATLARLDTVLWTFDPQDFIPHARLRAGRPPDEALAETPIWLVDAGAVVPQVQVLVNLGPGDVPEASRYARVIEIVGEDEDDRRAARRRWRAYEAAGLPVTHHPQGAATPGA